MSTVILRRYKQVDSQGVNRTYAEFECDHCKTPHSRPAKNIRPTQNFCSPECFYAHLNRGPVEVVCAYCTESFLKKRSHMNGSKSGLYFCSRVCKDRGQSLNGGVSAIQPAHYGTGKEKIDYRSIAFGHHGTRCNRCGWGKHVPVLDVHHIDLNRANNDPSNLEVLCPTCHQSDHYVTRTGRFRGMK